MTQTSANVGGNANSNILEYYDAGAHDNVNNFVASYCFYLTGTINEAEFDTYQFNNTMGVKFMFGTQCVSGSDWDIWNQKTGTWVSLGSSVPCSLTFNAIHNMYKTMHYNLSDSGNCSSQICMYYDSMVLDGVVLCAPCGSPQPSGSFSGTSASGFQFQIDITAPNTTGSMYIDLADFSESQ